MMDRRKFFSKVVRGAVAAAIAAHLELGRLVPVLEPAVGGPLDYYVIDWPVVARNWTFGTYINDVLDGALSKEYMLNGKLICEEVKP